MEALLIALVYGSVGVAAVAILCVDKIEYALIPVLAMVVLTPIGFSARPDMFFLTFVEVLVILFLPAILIRDPHLIWQRKILWSLILLFVFYAVRLLVDLASTGQSLIVYLRDIRIIAPFLAMVFLAGVFRRQFGVSKRTLISICTVAVAMDAFYYLFGSSIGVRPTGIGAELLFRADVLRYQDDFSIVAFGFLNYLVFLHGRMSGRVFAIFLQIVISATSLNRVFMIFTAFCALYLLWEFTGRYVRSRLVRALGFAMAFSLVLLGGAGYMSTVASAEGEVAARLLELLDWNLLLAGLQLRFVEPALAGGYELNWLSALFGMGPSFQFYIPWFEYRGLNPSHTSVDSLIMYSFVKFGLLVPVLCLLIVKKCLWKGEHYFMNTWVWVYLIVHNGIGLVPFVLFIFLSLVTKPLIEVAITDRRPLRRALNRSHVKTLGNSHGAYDVAV